jgi:predicted nucleic acid-binding Zn ribbon protein
MVAKNCKQCGKGFNGRRDARFCSPQCRFACWSERNRNPAMTVQAGAEFYIGGHRYDAGIYRIQRIDFNKKQADF